MRGQGKHALRVYRRRGARQLLRDALVEAYERQVGLKLKPALIRRSLHPEDIETVCGTDGTFFDRYDDEETHFLDLPTTPYGFSPEEREHMEETYCSGITIGAPFVCEIADAELLGPEALALKNGHFVFENSLESGRRIATSCLRAVCEGTLPTDSNLFPPRDRLDAVVSLVGPWTHNYTHWFQDYLARLEGFEYYLKETGNRPDVLVPPDMSTWMRDALRAMGYGPDWWIEWEGGRVRVDRLIVPGVRRERPRTSVDRRLLYSPTQFRWIRDRVKENLDPKSTRPHAPRIYLSRANATVRRVANEEETLELLSNWGFKRYRPDEMSYAEQVTLFSNAEAIVSSHGSGLLNQIYAEDATVIEIFGPKHGTTDPAIEYYLADLLGHDYGCMQGTPVGCDVEVDLEALEALLNQLLE